MCLEPVINVNQCYISVCVVNLCCHCMYAVYGRSVSSAEIWSQPLAVRNKQNYTSTGRETWSLARNVPGELPRRNPTTYQKHLIKAICTYVCIKRVSRSHPRCASKLEFAKLLTFILTDEYTHQWKFSHNIILVCIPHLYICVHTARKAIIIDNLFQYGTNIHRLSLIA